SRLSPIVRDLGLASIEELVQELRTTTLSPNGTQQRVVEAMTTNETSFFRDIHPFEAIRQSVLPDLIQHRQADRTLNLWCAAASSGTSWTSTAIHLK
ncbi:MAG: protein-glutamate O-methyltransferase CheR, partial [Chloroflexi bacterium]|nr:protein-glutamate O-methyltransferase CheR [Chloroflexota bacterium]